MEPYAASLRKSRLPLLGLPIYTSQDSTESNFATISLNIPTCGKRPEIFDAMVTAMFEEARAVQHDMQLPTHLAEQVYSMDPELPAEVIDAVFKDAGGF